MFFMNRKPRKSCRRFLNGVLNISFKDFFMAFSEISGIYLSLPVQKLCNTIITNFSSPHTGWCLRFLNKDLEEGEEPTKDLPVPYKLFCGSVAGAVSQTSELIHILINERIILFK